MEIMISFILAFALGLLLGKLMIPALRRLKAGQSIREDGPTWHASKAGTPTMGGLIFILAILTASFVAGWRQLVSGDFVHLLVFVFASVFGAIGLTDDYVKVKKKRNLGLKAYQKFLLQAAAAVAFIAILRNMGYLSPNLYVPFINTTIHLGWGLYLPLAAFIIVGTVNAVNITDGVDGLATGVTIPVAMFFVISSTLYQNTALGIFAAATLGGLSAFLVYNFHPAKVFMGDTGSLFLGGAICGMAFVLDMPLILIPVGIIYIAETLSDLIQISYFKMTHGKRIFKMAPLHHHLEMSGWNEIKIFGVFTMTSVVFCALALLGIMNRYV